MTASASSSLPTRRAPDAALIAVLGIACLGVALVASPLGSLVLLTIALGTLVLCGGNLELGALRFAALGLVGAVLAIDNPQELPADGRWRSPFYDLGTCLFDNLNKVTGIEVLHISLLDVAIVGVAFATWVRVPPPAHRCVPLRDVCIFSVVALVALEAWGLVTGGDLRNSLWQVRQPLAAPILALVLGRLLDPRRHAGPIAVLLIGAASLKTTLGLYVYEAIYRPLNERPAYTTTHSDSVLFVVALALTIAFALHRRTSGALLTSAILAPAFVVGIIINNRRLAWVEAALSLLVVYLFLPRNRTKQVITRFALSLIPVTALYFAVGWSSSSRVFLPVHIARSLGDTDADRSAATRDIENYNLIQTLKTDPLLGTGFGHEYREVSKADDISSYFAQYRFIPHNSLLGLWAFGGWLGFSLVWLPAAAALFLAARAYRFARDSLERTSAVVAVTALVAYAVQCWGDMGLQSWPNTVLESLAIAWSGRLAVSAGAWPRVGGGKS